MTFSTSFPYEAVVPDMPDEAASRFSAHYYWMFTIRPAECRMFNAVFDRVGSSEQAIRFLAGRYPLGLPPESVGTLTDEDLTLLSRLAGDLGIRDAHLSPPGVAVAESVSLEPAPGPASGPDLSLCLSGMSGGLPLFVREPAQA